MPRGARRARRAAMELAERALQAAALSALAIVAQRLWRRLRESQTRAYAEEAAWRRNPFAGLQRAGYERVAQTV